MKIGENSRLIRLTMNSQRLPKIDITNPAQVQNRIFQYFIFCQQHGTFPSVCGLSNWIGVHRDTLHAWKTGEHRKETHQEIILKAYAVIESALIDALMNDNISSAAGIFLLKSMFGYSDRLDLEATVKRDPFADTRKGYPELIQKYLLAIQDGEQEDEKDD